MTAPTVYLWIEKVQPEGCTFSKKAASLWDSLAKNSQNQAYLDDLTRPAQPSRVISQRVTAIGCLLRVMDAVCPHLLPSMTLHREADGRPFASFEGKDAPVLSFSLSHTQDLAVCALCVGHQAVGVDVESLIPSERAEKIARRFFSEDEQAMAKAWEDGRVGVTTLWTAKEAVFKRGGYASLLACDVSALPKDYRVEWGLITSPAAVISVCLPATSPAPTLLYAPFPQELTPLHPQD